MRVLRSSLYTAPAEPPTTVVVRDSDTRDTLEGVRASVAADGANEALMVFDIFDMPDGSIVEATAEAFQRQQARADQERHMAMLYWWTVITWQRVTPGGIIFMDKPAPLSREEICVVFEQLANRGDYQDFRVTTHTRDGEPVELIGGKIA